MGKFFKIRPYAIKLNFSKYLLQFEYFFFWLSYYNYHNRWINKYCNNLKFNDFYNKSPNAKNKFDLHRFIIKEFNLENQPIDYYEFGVYKGDSIKFWLNENNNLDSRFYGFDSFTGLPETWSGLSKGYFSTDGNPPIVNDERCQFVSGLFQETVFEFIKNKDFNKRTIFHFDADLYSSTLFVMITIYPKLKVGDILIFDEFSITLHEFRALMNFIEITNIDFKVVAAINNYNQIALEILKK